MSEHFINGALAGMCGLVVSHPFDTIKNRIQSGQKVDLGIRALYKGVTPPLLGVGFEKMVVFGVYDNAFRYFHKRDYDKYSYPMAGALSGFAASFIVAPFERIKIQLQTNGGRMHFHNVFTGLSATFTREIPGFAIYFSTYHGLKNRYYPQNDIPIHSSFLYGGLSGALAWFFIYPQDLIKTKMQASNEPLKFTAVLKDIYRRKGFTGFYRGFHFSLMRAIPLHAGTFAANEFLKSWVQNKPSTI